MRPSEFQGLTIFTRLSLSFVVVTVGVCSLLVVATYSFYSRSITRYTRESLIQQLTIIHDRFHQEYGVQLTRTLRALSTSVVLDDYLISSQTERIITGTKVKRAFQQALNDVTSCRSITFSDLLGQAEIRALDSRSHAPYPLVNQPTSWLINSSLPTQRIASDRLRLYLEGQPAGTLHIEGPFVDDQAEVGFIAGLSKLDLDTGDLAGIVLIQHSLMEFLEALDQIKVLGARPVWAFSPEGILLHQPHDSRQRFDPRPRLPQSWQPKPHVMKVAEGLLAYQDYALLPGQPFLRVAVTVPTPVLLQDLRPAFHFFSGVFGAALGVVLVVALLLSRYLSRPVVALATAATRVAHGDTDVRVSIQAGGEVKLLVDSFNKMSDDLQQTTVSRDTLVQEVMERQRTEVALHKAKTEAETANIAKSEFLANMSHELRTPLHGILSFAALGLERFTSAKPERIGHYFGKIQDSGEVLMALLNDLLDLAKFEAGKMSLDFQRGDLRVPIASITDEFRSLLSEHSMTLYYDPPATPVFASVDTQRFIQVLRNLLSNAVKFSPEGGVISLDLCCCEDNLRITVHDQGPGIPPDELETIFDKFVQSSTTKTGAGGTGLGLAICREIMAAHQGRIWAESAPHEGALLICELPQNLGERADVATDENQMSPAVSTQPRQKIDE